ncbi:MAG: response regulator transcription factor [Verrucomicrobiota bacterium]
MNIPASSTLSAAGPGSPDGRTIAVSIVEDDPEARGLLEDWLNAAPGFRCASTHPDVPSALAGLPGERPDIVLMDINLPGGTGIECIGLLKPQMPQTQFLVITVYDDANSIYQALEAGATGYLLKRTSKEELFASLRLLQAGGSPMSSGIARRVAQAFQVPPVTAAAAEEELSDRECEVLDLLARGHAEKEIADEMSISRHTVHTYIRRIYEKLQVHSQAQAVASYSKRQQRKAT